METAKLKSSTRKIVKMLTILMVVAGAIAFSIMSSTAHADGELMSRMFLIFFGIIITVQIIPGMMLFGVMLKELCGLGRKAEVRK